MEKIRAINLLDNVFNKKFDESRFSSFIGEVFNKSVSKFEEIRIYKGFKEYIDSGKLLKIYDIKKGKVAVISVKMKKTSSRDLARTMQRNFVARYIENEGIENALVAFYDSSEDWRFSFIEVNYKLDSKGKPIKNITSAKRSSFLVGPNEPNHTCQKQFMPLLENLGDLSIEELRAVFEIEKVTKEFFREYKEHFLSFVDSINKLIKKDKIIGEEFDKQDIDPSDFVKKLMGQLVFLYFIQKKGWLGVDKNNKWGTGNTKFLTDLFKECKSNNENFFNDYLEYLFHNALAKDRRLNDDYFAKFRCKIPFLNGGLFEPYNNYDWEKTDINLENNIFEKLFDFLNRYNFTIKEDEPLDREVAVDPEMLGKVFENLLDINDRKKKGAFYTPREIVHYMCQQSLLNYLETNTKIKRKDLEKFVLEGDYYLERTKLFESKKIEAVSDWTLPKSIKQNYELLDKLLTDIKVIDPAVGSGAFPMGMMNEIVKLRQILSIYFSENKQKRRTEYNLKRSTIENCIYGVDIMPSAIEICKLRFWLSLVIDEEGNKIEPLPNLENKLRIGNSLLEEFEGVKLFDERLLGGDTKVEYKQSTLNEILKYRIKKSEEKLRELKNLHKQFFNEEDNREKNKLRNTIDRIEWELIEETLKEENNEGAIEKLNNIKKNKSKPFFLWKLYFSEVFQRENPGFDVVIGNPPYVNNQEIDSDFKPAYSKFETAFQKYDLYVLFYELGINLLKKDATLSFITSNKFLSQKYGLELRKLFLKNKLDIIINFNYNVFDSATVRTSVIQVSKKYVEKNTISIIDIHTKEQKDDFITKNYKYIQQSVFDNTEENNFRINLTQDKLKVLRKIENNCLQVQDICSVNYGLRPSSEKLKLKKESFIYKKKEKPELKNYFEGKDMGYWSLKNSYYLDYQPKIMYNPMFKELFENNKLVGLRTLSDISKLRFIYDDKMHYCNDSVVILTLWHEFEKINHVTIKRNINSNKIEQSKNYNLFYLQSILNSKMIKFYFNELYYDGTHFYPNHMKVLPIKEISPEQQKPFIQLVDQILSITKDEDYLENKDKQAKVHKLEKEIDQLVYKLYDLTPEEIKIVEEFNKK